MKQNGNRQTIVKAFMCVFLSLFIDKMATKKGYVNIYQYNGSKCPLCGCFIELRALYSEYCAMTPIACPFRDAVSFKEYEMTGLCQSCQDNVWGRE